MNFVKIGSQWLNMDNVTLIEDYGDTLHLYFNYATPGEHHGSEFQKISGGSVTLLRSWLQGHAEDVVRQPR